MNVVNARDTLAMFHRTSGGSSDTELKLLAVMPQKPAGPAQVTTVTPVANLPRPSRNSL